MKLENETKKDLIGSIFKIYGIENFEITLLKEYKILNKNNLLAYE